MPGKGSKIEDMVRLTDWKRNVLVYQTNSVFNWFQAYIGVWVLIWTKYLNFTQIGLIYSIGLFWCLILELPSGALADLIGRKKTVLLGRLAILLGYSIFCFADNFWLFLIANMLYQTNEAFESGAHTALLYDSLKENGQAEKYYKKTETDTYFYCTLGMVVGSIIGGFLYKYGIHMPYMACVISAIVSLIIALFLQEPYIDSEKFTLKNYLSQHIEVVKHIFENQMIRAVTFFSIIIAFITYTGVWYLYEPRLTEGGFDARLMGLLVGGTYIIRALGVKLIPVLDRTIKSHQVPFFLIVSQIIASFISFFPGKMAAITSVYGRKFIDGFRYPIMATLQNENIDSKYRATSLSAISLFTNILVASAGPIIGILIDRYHSSFALGVFGFVGLLMGIPLALNLANRMKIQERYQVEYLANKEQGETI